MTTEIDWSFNCLTEGIHRGRPEAIWNIPLHYAEWIFGVEVFRELVIARIYNDAMQLVEHGDAPRPSKAWADKVKEYAEEIYPNTLSRKVEEIKAYYDSHSFQYDIKDAVERVQRNKLNPHYAPLHPHDSINMFCRIVGSPSSFSATAEVS